MPQRLKVDTPKDQNTSQQQAAGNRFPIEPSGERYGDPWDHHHNVRSTRRAPMLGYVNVEKEHDGGFPRFLQSLLQLGVNS